jgi:hypothetical protein
VCFAHFVSSNGGFKELDVLKKIQMLVLRTLKNYFRKEYKG